VTQAYPNDVVTIYAGSGQVSSGQGQCYLRSNLISFFRTAVPDDDEDDEDVDIVRIPGIEVPVHRDTAIITINVRQHRDFYLRGTTLVAGLPPSSPYSASHVS
jgi:hypothetical protein